MKKILYIILNAVPVAIMVGLIPYVSNDFLLTGIYALVIVVALLIKREKHDITFLVFGFVIMLASEYFFIQTGVETFRRTSLFNIMPLWLPFLWSYGFVAIKRSAKILGR